MCTDFGPNWLRFAGLIPERIQKSKNNIGFQPTMKSRLVCRRWTARTVNLLSNLTFFNLPRPTAATATATTTATA